MGRAHVIAAGAGTPAVDRRRSPGSPVTRPDGGPLGPARSGDVLSLRLGGGEAAPGRARRALSRLRGQLDEPLLETLRLLVTEVVGNSVRHAGARDVGLRVAVSGARVVTEISDDGPGFEPLSEAEMTSDDSGWGLLLVERLTERWGVSRDGGTTSVWFELRRA